jgi:hypothetical protein
MTAITDKANFEYRDMESPGSTVPNEPDKAGIRQLFGVVDGALASLGVNGAITVKKATKALLDADLAHVADTLAVVYNDATAAYNGIYAKSGGSGSGAWTITDLALPMAIAAELYALLDLKVDDAQIDTDPTMSANSNSRVPAQSAVLAYLEAFLAANASQVFIDGIDCSANPNYPAADQGWVYRVSVAGKIGGASGVTVAAGDMMICKADATPSGNQAAVGASWVVIPLNLSGALALAIPATRETAARMAGRAPLPCGPVDFSSLLTDAPDPYGRWDGNSSVIGFDSSWLIPGEDCVMQVIDKQDLSTMRVDREPDWTQASPWSVSIITKCAPGGHDSPNAFLQGSAREPWDYVDPGTGKNVTTGYAIVVGSGDLASPGVYRSPSVFFWREGASAAISLTNMLDVAGIMGGVYSSPRCLQQVARTSAETFYLCGSGNNQSTNPASSRATFGKMVLTLTGSKTQTGVTGVTSLTWTDYLATLQAAMPVGETIVNVPAVANQLLAGVLYVMVVTEDGGGVLRARLVQFTVATNAVALDALNDAGTGNPKFPLTPFNDPETQSANICVSPTGILWTLIGVSGVIYAGFRANAETVWHDAQTQIWRALGLNGTSPYSLSYDATRARFVVAGGTQGEANVGWLDSLCKQGHPYSRAFPAPMRYAQDDVRCARGVWTDAQGTIVIGDRQLAMFIPENSVEPSPNRVLWGLRVTPNVAVDTVTVSEGEAEFYQSDGTTVRKYYAGGTLGSITGGGSGVTRLVVLTSAAVLQQPGLGFLAGVDYPDSALWNQVVLASVTRTVAGVVITTGEIDQTTFRDQ